MGSGQKITSINNKKPPSAENQRELFFWINAFVMGFDYAFKASSTATAQNQDSARWGGVAYPEIALYSRIFLTSASGGIGI